MNRKDYKTLKMRKVKRPAKRGNISPRKIAQIIKRMKVQKELESLPRIETKDMEANQILAKAYDEMEGVVLAGYDKEGEFYFASSIADGGEILWLIEKLKLKLLRQL